MKAVGNGNPCSNGYKKKATSKPIEMYRTFNCGVGMVIALPQSEVETALSDFKTIG